MTQHKFVNHRRTIGLLFLAIAGGLAYAWPHTAHKATRYQYVPDGTRLSESVRTYPVLRPDYPVRDISRTVNAALGVHARVSTMSFPRIHEHGASVPLLASAHPADAPTAGSSSMIGRPVLVFPPSNWGPSLLDAITLPGGGVAASGLGSVNTQNAIEAQVTCTKNIAVLVLLPGHTPISESATDGPLYTSRIGIARDKSHLIGTSPHGIWTINLKNGDCGSNPITVPAEGPPLEFWGQNIGRPMWDRDKSHPVFVAFKGAGEGSATVVTRLNGQGKIDSVDRVLRDPITINGQTSTAASEALSPNGRTLAVEWSAEVDTPPAIPVHEDYARILDLRDVQSGTLIRRLLPFSNSGINCKERFVLGNPVFSNDGKFLAVVEFSGTVFIFNTTTGHLEGRITLRSAPVSRDVEHALPIEQAIAFSQNGQLLAASQMDGAICEYSLRTFRFIKTVGKIPIRTDAFSKTRSITPLQWLAFDANGRTLYGVERNGNSVLAWNEPPMAAHKRKSQHHSKQS